jgi:hypothetical protein
MRTRKNYLLSSTVVGGIVAASLSMLSAPVAMAQDATVTQAGEYESR